MDQSKQYYLLQAPGPRQSAWERFKAWLHGAPKPGQWPVLRLQKRQRIEFRIKGMRTFPTGFIFQVDNLLRVPHFGEWVFIDFTTLMPEDQAYNAKEELEAEAGGLRVIDVAHNFGSGKPFIRIDLVPHEMYASVAGF